MTIDNEFVKWFKNYLVIEQKVTIRFNTSNGKTARNDRIDSYVFMDFERKRAAEYAIFSDTARPLQTFALYDTVTLTAGNAHEPTPDTSTLSRHVDMLPDTVIDNIRYKRAVRSYTQNIRNRPSHYVQVYYLRPDLSEELGNVFFWRDSLTRALKAPIVWAEDKPSVHSSVLLVSARLVFVADTLSVYEEKVFNAWEKNSRND